ncbi:MAG: polysaccharide biosynthesis/export family protein [Bryobacteraceae bacterium]
MTPSSRYRGSLIPLLVLAALTVFCFQSLAAPQQEAPQAPAAPSAQQGGDASKDTGDKSAGPGIAAPVDPRTYKIGAEDVLKVSVWREPELSSHVAVRPDGMVTIPLVGEVQVSGLTPLEFTDKLKEEFGKLVNNPVVSVEVWQVRSRKYYIAGMVPRPGQYPLVVPVTVLEALTLAGGPTEWANKKKIIIMRGDKRIKFNWNDVIKGKNLDQNVYLEPGDFVNVP